MKLKTSDDSTIITYQPAPTKSYLPHTNKQPKIVVDYVWNVLLKNESEKVKSLFGTLDKLTEIYLYTNEGYAPIPWQTLKKYGFREAMERLIKLNMVDVKGEIRPKENVRGYCREYRLKLDLFFEITKLSIARVDTYSKRGFVLYNLITGKKVKRIKYEEPLIYKYNKTTKKKELIVSPIVANGITPIKFCVVNYFFVEEYLNYFRWLFEDKNLEKNLTKYKSFKDVKDSLSESKYLSYLNDERCWQNILACRTFDKMENFNKEWRGYLRYIPVYESQSTGRKSEVGGGFQSCSREMKQEAFNYIPGVRNYDLKSSQIYCLRYQFMACRLNYKLLDYYLSADKEVLAKQIGLDKDTWKGINYGTYFGGFPTDKIKNIKIYNNEKDFGNLYSLLGHEIVYRHICNFLGIKTYYNQGRRRRECELINNNASQTVIAVCTILRKFYAQNRELLEEVEHWHKYLTHNFPRSSTTAVEDNKKYIFNRSQMALEVTQYQNRKGKLNREGVRKLASHLLQGQEAQFISYLTWYSESDSECPYTVLSDQHDGLIVLGTITEKYIEKARQETEFFNAYLVEKPYL